MPYTPQTWADTSGGGTPLSAARLNYIETGVDDATTTADAASTAATTAASDAATAQASANSAASDAATAQTTANAAVPKSTGTTKGDLLVATASGVITRLPVGTDGRVLVPDSAQTSGLKWGRKTTVSATAPAGPQEGDLWIKPGGGATTGSGASSSRVATDPTSWPSPVLRYNDPTSGKQVVRLTTDGASASAINFIGRGDSDQGSGTSPWSPDSTMIVYAKKVASAPLQNGIYIFDLVAGQEAAICTCDSQFAYPIFSHDGTEIYFINGAAGTAAGPGGDNKPYEIRKVTVPTTLTYGGLPANTSVQVLDIKTAAITGDGTTDVVSLGRNCATSSADALFSFQHVVASGWRTVVFNASGTLYTNWDFSSANRWHDSLNDGSVAIWSPSDPYLLYTNRAVGGSTSHVAARAVWDVRGPHAVWQPTTTDGSVQVTSTAWGYHPDTGTDIMVGSGRDPFTHSAAGGSIHSAKGQVGYGHPSFDAASMGGELGEGRVAWEEFLSSSDAGLYVSMLSDWDIGITSDYPTNYADIKTKAFVCGHRNRLEDYADADLYRYHPSPSISPDGRWLLWQSNSLNSLNSVSYPSGSMGASGGSDGTASYTDLYLTNIDLGIAETAYVAPAKSTTAVIGSIPSSQVLFHTNFERARNIYLNKVHPDLVRGQYSTFTNPDDGSSSWGFSFPNGTNYAWDIRKDSRALVGEYILYYSLSAADTQPDACQIHRLFDEDGNAFPNEIHVSGWYYFPQQISFPNLVAGGPHAGDFSFTNMMQNKSRVSGVSQPCITLGAEMNTDHGDLAMYWKGGNHVDGGFSAVTEFGTPPSIPIATWTHLEMRLGLSETTTGYIQVWQDGVKIMDQASVQTEWTGTTARDVSWNLYCEGVSPADPELILDDIAITTTQRVGALIPF